MHITDEEIPGKTLKVNAGKSLHAEITELLDEPIEWNGVIDYGSKRKNVWRTKLYKVNGDTAQYIYKEPINCSKLTEIVGFPAFTYINKFKETLINSSKNCY